MQDVYPVLAGRAHCPPPVTPAPAPAHVAAPGPAARVISVLLDMEVCTIIRSSSSFLSISIHSFSFFRNVGVIKVPAVLFVSPLYSVVGD